MSSGTTSFINTNKLSSFQLLRFKKIVTIARIELSLKKHDLSVIFYSDKKIRELNKLYRKKDKVTDVLSFFYSGEGEVFISLPQAKRQAKDNQVSLLNELIKLLIHGLVHIAGYDHETEKDYLAMQVIENKIYVAYQTNH